MKEIIVYRNPAEKMMWDFWMNLDIRVWYAFFIIVGIFGTIWIISSVRNRK